jgi:urate oxidase
VSEAGFMMDNETLQVILEQFVEVRNNISAVSSGQEELKNDVSVINKNIQNSNSFVKNEKFDLETKINAGQGEMKQEISDIKEDVMKRHMHHPV